ncbi:hypothetical protein EV702DRAFT_1042684 [Suillus placidus]|uniref:Uncharacterized protein n=1 Tax=Suillus placidus TaxID=48579 RepID=A0A9P7A228_9AGAM|nr:hypothetical protein EV702DRAFT_1042684 [Suillus placidus]
MSSHTIRSLICVRPLVQSATLGSSACAAWQDTATETSIPSGLLIANDSNSKWAHLLIHQSARLPSPAFMVTNLDASIFPILRLPITTADPRRGIKKSSNQLLFDLVTARYERILGYGNGGSLWMGMAYIVVAAALNSNPDRLLEYADAL